jgi:hypothetical protein
MLFNTYYNFKNLKCRVKIKIKIIKLFVNNLCLKDELIIQNLFERI